jgi:RimJ/RimL family protein N-acetyltransferase
VPLLRAVAPTDLDALYEQQADPESSAMAGVPSRDREAFEEQMRGILANDQNLIRVIDVDGEAAGSVLSWPSEGRRYVGYRVAREFWGRGLATAALAELLGELQERPLHALVSTENVASIRVLEKCGFVEVGRHTADDGIVELVMELGR